MAKHQKYGIKYPFTSDNEDNVFLDVNGTLSESVKSQVLHVIFTPKGQKIRDPQFGTDLVKFIFNPNDSLTFSDIKAEISSQVNRYVPGVEFRNINIYKDETDDSSIIVTVEYGVRNGNKIEVTNVGIKL